MGEGSWEELTVFYEIVNINSILFLALSATTSRLQLSTSIVLSIILLLNSILLVAMRSIHDAIRHYTHGDELTPDIIDFFPS